MTTTDKPSIAELQRRFDENPTDEQPATPLLLEIAAAAKRLEGELQYLIGPESRRLQEAIAKVRP